MVVPCCSSSSSDEAEHVGKDNGGWPSVVSVLETPDRRRVRKTLRSTNKTVAAARNGQLQQQQQKPHNYFSLASSSPSAVSSSSLLYGVNANASSNNQQRMNSRNNDGLTANANNFQSAATSILFTSPPLSKQQRISYSSPSLHTPKQQQCLLPIHLSRSPYSSFVFKTTRTTTNQQNNNNEYSLSSTTKSNNSISSYSPVQVLRPLNLHNYTRIQLNGSKNPQQLTRSKFEESDVGFTDNNSSIGNGTSTTMSTLLNKSENSIPSSNCIVYDEKQQPTPSEDSGFFDTSYNGSSDSIVRSAQLFPSATSSIHRPLLQTSSFLSMDVSVSQMEKILPFEQYSPEYCGTTILPDLIMEQQNSFAAYSSNFPSPIPEQSFGKIERGILNGILNDPLLWKANTSLASIEGGNSNNKPPEILANINGESFKKSSPVKHSPIFEEHIICDLKRKRGKVSRTTVKVSEEIGKGKKRTNSENSGVGLPSNLFIDIDGNNGLGSKNKENECFEWFPKFGLRDYELMFGQTPDQKEVTRQAHVYRSTKLNEADIVVKSKGATKSAGVPIQLRIEVMNRKVKYWKV